MKRGTGGQDKKHHVEICKILRNLKKPQFYSHSQWQNCEIMINFNFFNSLTIRSSYLRSLYSEIITDSNFFNSLRSNWITKLYLTQMINILISNTIDYTFRHIYFTQIATNLTESYPSPHIHTDDLCRFGDKEIMIDRVSINGHT